MELVSRPLETIGALLRPAIHCRGRFPGFESEHPRLGLVSSDIFPSGQSSRILRGPKPTTATIASSLFQVLQPWSA